MADCVYCGKPAGLLRKKHKECEAIHNAGWNRMVEMSQQAAIQGSFTPELEAEIRRIASSSYFPEDRIREVYAAGWERAVDHFLEDGDLSVDEEASLTRFAEGVGLSEADMDRNGAKTRLVKGIVLRELMEGKVPARFRVTSVLPFNFQKNESLVWAFNDVTYLEDKTRRRYVGGSSGVSVRIAKGVYYRFGQFRGTPVETTETVRVGVGVLALTTKSLYFAGPGKSLRIPYKKIVTVTPFRDGIGVHRDAATAGPQYFLTNDGWFTYNLVINLSRLD
jgi:hypothetical protein